MRKSKKTNTNASFKCLFEGRTKNQGGTAYDVYCDFDVKRHKRQYFHYLEVVITRDGVVHYAVPSHDEYLIHEAMRRLGISRDDLVELCPKDKFTDYRAWLSEQAGGAICVYSRSVQIYGAITHEQYNTLLMLQKEGVYEGPIPTDVVFDEMDADAVIPTQAPQRESAESELVALWKSKGLIKEG